MKIALYCLNSFECPLKKVPKYVNDRNFKRIREANGGSQVSEEVWKDLKEKNKEYYYGDVYDQKLWFLYHKILQERTKHWWD